MTILGSNDVQRDPLATTDPGWSWTHSAREAYDLEANSLYDFLSWATRETGLVLRFENDAVRRDAARTPVCCGKVSVPSNAINDVLDASENFRAVESEAYEMIIGFRR